jgi:hypothetical protein
LAAGRLAVCVSDFVERPRAGGVTKTQTLETGENSMLKFIGGTAGIIFIIGLIVVIGIFKLLF